ncbi:unnamed protein product, partial [Cladocopium goreaui]
KSEEELQYVRARTQHPPKGRKRLGKIGNFELVRHPTYMDIKWINSPRESQCSAIASLVTGIGATRLSQLELNQPLGLPLTDLQPEEASTVSACPSSAPPEMLKYQNHSSDWMRRLEGQALYGAGLGAAPTVESLGRSLQVLKTRRPDGKKPTHGG